MKLTAEQIVQNWNDLLKIINDNFKGGEFAFFGGEYKIPKKKGSALIFPSNFCYPHAVLPVSGGDRHAVITWVH